MPRLVEVEEEVQAGPRLVEVEEEPVSTARFQPVEYVPETPGSMGRAARETALQEPPPWTKQGQLPPPIQKKAYDLAERFKTQLYNKGIVNTVNTFPATYNKWVSGIGRLRGKPEKEIQKGLVGMPMNEAPLPMTGGQEGTGEVVADAAAGLGAFVGQLALTKKVLGPGLPEPLYWEAQSLANGGTPGMGAAMAATFGAIKAIPAKGRIGQLGKMGAESAVLGGITAAEGGSPAEVLTNMAIPAVMQGPGFGRMMLRGSPARTEAIRVSSKDISEPPATEATPVAPEAVAKAEVVPATVESSPEIVPPRAIETPSEAKAAVVIEKPPGPRLVPVEEGAIPTEQGTVSEPAPMKSAPGFAGFGDPTKNPTFTGSTRAVMDTPPPIEVKQKPKDLGPLAKQLTLSNQAAKTRNPTIIKAANNLVDTGLVIREETDRRVIDSDHMYRQLPAEYKAAKGKKFFETMDQTMDPAAIDASKDIPEAAKPSLKFFKNIEEDVRLDIIEHKRDMNATVHMRKTLPELQQEAASRGLPLQGNETKIEIATALAKQDVPDTWGRQWSHIQHIFFGNYNLQVVDPDGKPHFIGRAETKAEAVQKLYDWHDQAKASGVPNADQYRLTVDTDFSLPMDVTRLSRKHYFALVSSLKEAMNAEKGEIEDAAKGIIGKKESKQKFWGALQRRAGAEGYSTDFQRVWNASTAQYVRWKHLTNMNRTVTPLIEKLRADGLTRWAEHLEFNRDNLMGKKRTTAAQWFDEAIEAVPVLADYTKPYLLERMVNAVKTANYWRHLQTGRFYVVNSLQPIQTLWPVIGEKGMYRAFKLYYSPEGQAKLRQYGVAAEGKLRETGYVAMKRTKGWSPAALSERRNQGLAFLGLYDHARGMGMTEVDAAQYARLRGQVMTQFAYSPADVPRVMQSNLGGLIFQYKRFTVKNMELVARLAREKNYGGVARWVAGLAIVGGANAALKIGGGLTGGYLTYKVYQKIKDEYGKETADMIHHGLPGLLGIDISGSVTPFDLPYGKTATERAGNFILGPTGSTAVQLYTDLADTDVAREIGGPKRFLTSLKNASPTVKQFEFLYKALTRDTSNLDARQREAYKLTVTDLWKKAFGFVPGSESLQRMQVTAMLDVKQQYDKALDNVALRIIGGDNAGAQKAVDQWNASWPEAPISKADAEARIKNRGKAQPQTKTERTFGGLPSNIKVAFPEQMASIPDADLARMLKSATYDNAGYTTIGGTKVQTPKGERLIGGTKIRHLKGQAIKGQEDLVKALRAEQERRSKGR